MPQIMGIVNCTPDSFYDGGKYPSVFSLVNHALKMVEEGADYLDLGGESTRPNSKPVSANVEISRVLPILLEIRKHASVPISIDTTKSEVAKVCLENGANVINDVSGGANSDLLKLVCENKVPIILMHSRGTPLTMHGLCAYEDVVLEVITELKNRIGDALHVGVQSTQIRIDPGFGFAKDFAQNIILLKNLKQFKELGYPLVVGLSRKSFIGKLTHKKNPKDRLLGSLTGAIIATLKGADILRVHDVGETREALQALTGLEIGGI